MIQNALLTRNLHRPFKLHYSIHQQHVAPIPKFKKYKLTKNDFWQDKFMQEDN